MIDMGPKRIEILSRIITIFFLFAKCRYRYWQYAIKTGEI